MNKTDVSNLGLLERYDLWPIWCSI